MPDWKTLKVGDRVRLLRVRNSDLEQRDRELREGTEMAGWTAETIERIIASDPVVTINRVDEFGAPWFERALTANDGTIDYHSLTITDSESLEFAFHD